MEPWIAIEADVDKGPNGEFAKLYPRYWEAVVRAGGRPLLVAPFPDRAYLSALLDRVDGLVMPGGDDLCPADARDVPGLVPALASRTRTASLLIELALERDLPLLAVCLGMQVLARDLGATLIYDLPSEHPTAVEHRGSGVGHDLEVVEGSLLARALGRSGTVFSNSMHHQAVAGVAPPLEVSARASDGVIEAIEHPGRSFCLGVQWHPEKMADDPAMSNLFSALVAAARDRQSLRSIPS